MHAANHPHWSRNYFFLADRCSQSRFQWSVPPLYELLPESVSVPVPILVNEPELMMSPEKIESNPLVSMVPPRARSEIVREVFRLPVVCKVPPLKSTNAPNLEALTPNHWQLTMAHLEPNEIRPNERAERTRLNSHTDGLENCIAPNLNHRDRVVAKVSHVDEFTGASTVGETAEPRCSFAAEEVSLNADTPLRLTASNPIIPKPNSAQLPGSGIATMKTASELDPPTSIDKESSREMLVSVRPSSVVGHLQFGSVEVKIAW